MCQLVTQWQYTHSNGREFVIWLKPKQRYDCSYKIFTLIWNICFSWFQGSIQIAYILPIPGGSSSWNRVLCKGQIIVGYGISKLIQFSQNESEFNRNQNCQTEIFKLHMKVLTGSFQMFPGHCWMPWQNTDFYWKCASTHVPFQTKFATQNLNCARWLVVKIFKGLSQWFWPLIYLIVKCIYSSSNNSVKSLWFWIRVVSWLASLSSETVWVPVKLHLINSAAFWCLPAVYTPLSPFDWGAWQSAMNGKNVTNTSNDCYHHHISKFHENSTKQNPQVSQWPTKHPHFNESTNWIVDMRCQNNSANLDSNFWRIGTKLTMT